MNNHMHRALWNIEIEIERKVEEKNKVFNCSAYSFEKFNVLRTNRRPIFLMCIF